MSCSSRSLAMLASLVLAVAGGIAPARVAAQDAEPIGLHLLQPNQGAHFGEWAVWRYDEGDKAFFLIHQKTGLTVYLPWTSNGWINYRTGDGVWHVLFSKGDAEYQKRDDLQVAKFLGKKPAPAAETGMFTFEATTMDNGVKETHTWTAKVTKEFIDFHNPKYGDRITIRANSSSFLHNGRTIYYHAFDGNVAQEDPKVSIQTPGGKIVELPAKSHDVQLIGGRKYRIDMFSKEIDSVIVLKTKDGKQLGLDDDSGGDLNSRLFFTPPNDDVYRIYSATLQGAGKYSLRVRDDTVRNVLKVGPGLKLEGKLDARTRNVVYSVEMVKGKSYVIDMTSNAFDSYLIVRIPGGKEIARDDDSGGNLNARIVMDITGTGVFEIVATSFNATGNGPFTITVRETKD